MTSLRPGIVLSLLLQHTQLSLWHIHDRCSVKVLGAGEQPFIDITAGSTVLSCSYKNHCCLPSSHMSVGWLLSPFCRWGSWDPGVKSCAQGHTPSKWLSWDLNRSAGFQNIIPVTSFVKPQSHRNEETCLKPYCKSTIDWVRLGDVIKIGKGGRKHILFLQNTFLKWLFTSICSSFWKVDKVSDKFISGMFFGLN